MHHDTQSTLEAARARVDAVHRDPDVDPLDLERAEQDLVYAQAEHDADIPWADSPEDVPPTMSERIALDGGHADVEVPLEHVELTLTLGARSTIGVALSATEAARIGKALTAAAHRAHVLQAAHVDLDGTDTVTGLLHRSRATGIPASALIEVIR